MVKKALLISGIGLFFLAVQPHSANAALAVQDNAALAKWSEHIAAMKEELSVVTDAFDVATEHLQVINEVSDTINETVNAIGEMTTIHLPFVNLAKLADQIKSDLQCLIPNLEKMLPSIEFEDVDWNNICDATSAYQKTLWHNHTANKDDEDGGTFDPQEAEARSQAQAQVANRRNIMAEDATMKGMAQSDVGRKAAEDLTNTADELFASAQAAKSLNQRMAVQNQATVALLKGQAQTNLLLAQLLRVQTMFFIQTMPPNSVANLGVGE